jgi:allophanate hydrolase
MSNATTGPATKRVRAALTALETIGRPEIWITLRGEDELLAEAAAIDTAVAAGAGKPLAGLLLAVKNNVDVAGIPTTAACPGFAYLPEKDAEAVARLRAAGALVLGATNLDQFATGLVGTRSPHGAVRDSRRPDFISGGSSSGSAVAVALGLVDIAIGTDTAGSGRVPAGLQGIVGIKPTLDVVPTAGVVPACRSWDAVTIFARHLATAELAMGVMAGGSRPWPSRHPAGSPGKAEGRLPGHPAGTPGGLGRRIPPQR